MDCSPPGSSAHGVLHARILEWVALHSSRGSSWPRDQTHISYVSCIGKWVFYHWATREVHILSIITLSLSLVMFSWLCQFPVTRVIDHHKLGLKQHKFVLLQSWGLQVRSQFHGATVKVLAGMVPSRGCEGKPISLSFLSPSVDTLWPLPPFSECIILISAFLTPLSPSLTPSKSLL